MKKRLREPKPLLPFLAAATGPSLIKHLASCNTSVRSQSLRLLQSWLSSQSQQLSDSDIKKLWKGLFYCLWHSDKTPNQVDLINRLTSLFLSLQDALSLEFFRAFLLTLRREWPGIDRLRLDKFYLLIRRFIKALFELMRLKKWDKDALAEYFGVLERDGFLAEDKLQGNGVNYHLVSVFLEELKGVGFPVRKEVVDLILGPFFAALMRSKDKILLGKIKNFVFDELLKVGKEFLSKKEVGVGCDENGGNMLLVVVALKMGLSVRFYEVGSSVDCIQGNRKVALGLHQEFMKLERDLESSGIDIAIPQYKEANDDVGVPQLTPVDFDSSKDNAEKGVCDGCYDDEVPQLIPIDIDSSKNDMENGVLCGDEGEEDEENRVSKKNKKAKKGKDGDDKKRKKKKKRKGDKKVSEAKSEAEENDDLISTNNSGISLSDDQECEGSAGSLSETVILNLQKQFEKVAAEMGSESDEDSDFSVTPLASLKPKRRKRAKVAHDQEAGNSNTFGNGDSGIENGAKSVERSAKKVRFSMKNNLVWKPQNPLPPESLRLPPSVTPRGSALKKGVPPGPIIEMPLVRRKAKQKKKVQNRLKGAPSMMIRRKKVQKRSM